MSRFPKALTFDVVGTLIDFESGMINSLRKLCGVAIDREAFLTAYRGMRARGQTLPFPQDLKPIYQELAPISVYQRMKRMLTHLYMQLKTGLHSKIVWRPCGALVSTSSWLP